MKYDTIRNHTSWNLPFCPVHTLYSVLCTRFVLREQNFPVDSKPALLLSRTPPGKNPNHEEGEQGNGKGSHGSGVVCHPGNEKEEAASHGSHHQE